MDLEYIEHIIKGSPYITEGRWNQWKAKAAQQMGSLGAMAGHQIQDPNVTKLRSLWEGFSKNLKKSIRDWERQVSPMFNSPNVELDGTGQTIKKILDDLARVMRPMDPDTINRYKKGYVDVLGANPTKKNPVGNNSLLQALVPKQKPPTKPPVTEDIGDASRTVWNAANRELKLNKALRTNDPAQILNAYKSYTLSIFDSFSKDAIKMTGLPKEEIYKTLAKMQPASHPSLKSTTYPTPTPGEPPKTYSPGYNKEQEGFQSSANMQKIVQLLLQLQKTADVTVKAPAGATPPMLPPKPPVIQQPQQPKPKSPAQPPPLPKQPHPPTGGGGGGGGAGMTGKGDYTPDKSEMPNIIYKAMKIIIDAVKSDSGHVGDYFTNKSLPTDFKQPQLSGEKKKKKIPPTIQTSVQPPAPPAPTVTEVDVPGDDPEDEPEEEKFPGEFVYNFHSKFIKFPGNQIGD